MRLQIYKVVFNRNDYGNKIEIDEETLLNCLKESTKPNSGQGGSVNIVPIPDLGDGSQLRIDRLANKIAQAIKKEFFHSPSINNVNLDVLNVLVTVEEEGG